MIGNNNPVCTSQEFLDFLEKEGCKNYEDWRYLVVSPMSSLNDSKKKPIGFLKKLPERVAYYDTWKVVIYAVYNGIGVRPAETINEISDDTYLRWKQERWAVPVTISGEKLWVLKERIRKTVIVSRHPGAIEWLRSKGIEGEVIEHLSTKDLTGNERIYGILPLPLIKEAMNKGCEVNILVLPAIAFGQRGQELSPTEMDEAGAKILKVKNLDLEEVEK